MPTAKKTTTETLTKGTAEEVRAKIAAHADEQRQEKQRENADKLQRLIDSITQREWLIASARLDKTRKEMDKDFSLMLLVAAWVQEKRSHGGAEWDRLLDCTDAEILALLDLDDPEAEKKQQSDDEGK